MSLVEQATFIHKLVYAYPVFSSLSTLVNIILAALIVFRLIYHRRCARNALGAEHGPPYTNIITMCVESSALMVIASGLFAVMSCVPVMLYGIVFMSEIITHICVCGLELNISDARLRFFIPLKDG